MKDYKLVASKIERFNNADYVKARIYLEIQELEIDHDPFVETAYSWWLNDERITPETLGLAIWLGLTNTNETEPEPAILAGLDLM